jgi:hypothetical protein
VQHGGRPGLHYSNSPVPPCCTQILIYSLWMILLAGGRRRGSYDTTGRERTSKTRRLSGASQIITRWGPSTHTLAPPRMTTGMTVFRIRPRGDASPRPTRATSSRRSTALLNCGEGDSTARSAGPLDAVAALVPTQLVLLFYRCSSRSVMTMTGENGLTDRVWERVGGPGGLHKGHAYHTQLLDYLPGEDYRQHTDCRYQTTDSTL